VCVCVWDCV